MTRICRDGRDIPFSKWLRNHPDIESNQYGLDIENIDYTFHKFKPWVDSSGTRDIKLIMDIELKTFFKNKRLSMAQHETLFLKHQLLNVKKKLYSTVLKKKVDVWCLGVYILFILDGETPTHASSMEWGKFDDTGEIVRVSITENTLINLLRFDFRPDNLRPLKLRRHHKTNEFYVVDDSGLFVLHERIVCRS